MGLLFEFNDEYGRRLLKDIYQMKEEFINTLNSQFNGQTSNRLLLAALGWEREFYQRVRMELVKEGAIKIGRGRGGTVRVV